MPGRLEFEHEVDNEAEMVVKDFEFGLVYKYGGDEQPQSKITRAAADEDEGNEQEEEEGKDGLKDVDDVIVKEEPLDDQPEASTSRLPRSSSPHKEEAMGAKRKGKANADAAMDIEEEDELEIKLALLDIYLSKLDKREEAKDMIFDRGLTEHKRVRKSSGPFEASLTICRYKRWSGNGQRTSESWYSGIRCSRSCRPLRISRCSLRV